MQVGVRIAGVTAVLVLALAASPAATAQSRPQPPHQAAIGAYVEELPTATGSVAAGAAFLSAQTSGSASGTGAGGSGGLLGLALVLAGTAVAIVVGRLRLRNGRDSRS